MIVPEILKVDISNFPIGEHFVQIPGKVVLTDNLEDKENVMEKRQHPSFPIQVTMNVSIICVSGKMEMEIDLKHYILSAGYTALLLTGSFFQMKNIEPDTKYIVIAISPDFIKFVGNVKTGIEFGNQLKEHPVHQPPTNELEENISLYKALKQKLLDKTYLYKEEVAKSYFRIMQCNIFQDFARITGKQGEPQIMGRKDELFMQFVESVKEHYIKHRNIVFYADLLCVSPKYLSSVVHLVSGKYATDWINQYVVLEAKTLLRSDGVSIKDVSNRLHFANQSFFAKYFKQHTGYTPKEYKAL